MGGKFTAAVAPDGSTVPRLNLLALDATTGAPDPDFLPEPNRPVFALVASPDGSTLYVGGAFRRIGGGRNRKLAALDPATGNALAGWRADLNGKVLSLALGNGRLYAGGSFRSVTDGVGTTARNKVAAVSAATGSLDQAWDARVEGSATVRSILLSSDGRRLYVGGGFTSVAGQTRYEIAAVDALTGGLDYTFRPSNPRPVRDMATDGTRLYLALAGSGGEARALDAVTGAWRWGVRTSGDVQAVGLHDGLLYVGGHFNAGDGPFGSQPRYKLAAVNPSTGAVDPYSPRVNSPHGVEEIFSWGQYLYVGGHFTKFAGVKQPHFAQLTV